MLLIIGISLLTAGIVMQLFAKVLLSDPIYLRRARGDAPFLWLSGAMMVAAWLYLDSLVDLSGPI